MRGLKLEFHPQSFLDLLEIKNYYESQRSGFVVCAGV